MHTRRYLVLLVGSVVVIATACGAPSKGATSKGAVPSIAGPTSGAGAVGGASSSAAGSGVASPAQSPVTGSGLARGKSANGTLGATVTPAGPKIITTADVAIRVKSGALTEVFSAVAGLATGAGGYVSDSSTSFGGPNPSAREVLRVPGAQFQGVMARLAGFGAVTSENISGQDVTTEVADNGAQLTTLQDEAQAARTLLARATSIGDILAIQDQVFALQSQIQQLSAQQAALSGEASYATVSVELTMPPVPASPAPHEGTPARTWHLAASNSAAVLRGIVLTLGWLAPLLVLGVLVGVPAWRWWRRRQRPPVPAAASGDGG